MGGSRFCQRERETIAVEWEEDRELMTREAILHPPRRSGAERSEDLVPLVPVTAFGPEFAAVFPAAMTHLNAMQSKVFVQALRSHSRRNLQPYVQSLAITL